MFNNQDMAFEFGMEILEWISLTVDDIETEIKQKS